MTNASAEKIKVVFCCQGCRPNLLPLTTYYLPLKNKKTMKKETWKTILQIIASIISAALTALGTTSCMGYGPMAL